MKTLLWVLGIAAASLFTALVWGLISVARMADREDPDLFDDCYE